MVDTISKRRKTELLSLIVMVLTVIVLLQLGWRLFGFDTLLVDVFVGVLAAVVYILTAQLLKRSRFGRRLGGDGQRTP